MNPLVAAAAIVSFLAGGTARAADESSAPLRGEGVVEVTSEPPGVLLAIDGRVDVTGVTPFRAERLPPGRYRVHVAQPGYTGGSKDLTLSPGGLAAAHLGVHRKSRWAAGMRSLVLPGWGQSYGERSGSALFYGLSTGTAAVVAGVYGLRYLDRRGEYDRALEAYREAGRVWEERAAGEVADARARVEQAHAQLEDARNGARTAAGVLGGVWAINFLDAIAFFPRFEALPLGEQTALHIRPNVRDPGVKLEVSHALP